MFSALGIQPKIKHGKIPALKTRSSGMKKDHKQK